MERTEMRTGFWWGDLKETDHLEDLNVEGCKILGWILMRWHGKA